MNLKKLLEVAPETLANEQHRALKNEVIAVLERVIDTIKRCDYNGVWPLLEVSVAGDGTGSDNTYIDFRSLDVGIEDIGDAVERLHELYNMSTYPKE